MEVEYVAGRGTAASRIRKEDMGDGLEEIFDVPSIQLFYSWCPLHRDSAEILRFAAETCLLMSTTNRFISLSHGETVNGNRLSDYTVRVLG